MMIIAMKKNKAVWGLVALGRREEGAVSNSVVREGLTEKGHWNTDPTQEGRQDGALWVTACYKGKQQVQRP